MLVLVLVPWGGVRGASAGDGVGVGDGSNKLEVEGGGELCSSS